MDGTPFGRYRLIELLGRGGMGEVWRAHDTEIDRTVAIKMLLPHFATDPKFEQRFRREARVAARLDDPHVVPIYDVGEIDGRLYVAMRLINGHDLQTLLDNGPLEPDRSRRITEQIASAVDAAHKAGLVHRDVKPSNILVIDEDFAYLIDFGIARAAGETGITSTGATIGTWAYMAPERFSGGEIEPSSDIYALACVLYQSLTGELPFPGTTLEQIAMGHMTTPPPKPSAHSDGIPAAMDTVISTGLAKDPQQRYRLAKDLAQAARAALDTRDQAQTGTIVADTQAAPTISAPDSTAAPKSVPSRRESSKRKPPKSRVVTIGATLAAVMLIAGLVMVWRPWQDNSSRTETTATLQPVISVAAGASPPPAPTRTAETNIQTTIAVVNGQPANGFREVPNPNANVPLDCEVTSRAAVTANVYDCNPTSASADICWSAPPESMLCLDNPWDKELRRFPRSTLSLPAIQHDLDPWPYAVELDDGARCRLRIGMRDMEPNGDTNEYDCGTRQTGFSIFMSRDSSNPINRASPMWTVKAGPLGAVAQIHTVTKAWFAGAE